MSVAIVLELGALTDAGAKIGRLADADTSDLMTAIGALGESQTRRRIEEEKTAPDGSAWKPNVEGTSILLRSGEHLRDGIAFDAGAEQAEWGASWEFAGVHQFGATITAKDAPALAFTIRGRKVRAKSVTIPARPFVGISAENGREIEDLTTDWLGGLF